MKPYTPKGKAALFVAEAEKDLMREYTSRQVSEVICCDVRAVSKMLEYAARNGLIFSRSNGRNRYWRGHPYREGQVRCQPESANQTHIRNGNLNCIQPRADWMTSRDDVRCQKVVPGWTPPKMVCVREGAGEWHSEEIAA